MAFTAQEIIRVYLFRWQMQEMTHSILSHLKPMPSFLDSTSAKRVEIGPSGGAISIRVPKYRADFK